MSFKHQEKQEQKKIRQELTSKLNHPTSSTNTFGIWEKFENLLRKK